MWVNTHGSFPLGVAWLVARAIGEALDGRGRPRWIERYFAFFLASLALAAINPLGVRLLAFPFAVRGKESVFKNVVEWRSPDFQTPQGMLTLVFLALALIILVRAKMGWKDTLPVVAFLGLGLFSVRNIAPLAVVLAPALGRAMSVASDRRATMAPSALPDTAGHRAPSSRLNLAIAAVLVATALVFVAGAQRNAAFDFSTYPTQAEAYMASHGLLDPTMHKVAVQDIVGCYLILLRGTTGRVFIDDRVDMYPVAVSNDYDTLLHGAVNSPALLDKYGIDTVLWDGRLALPGVLRASGGWRQVYPEPNSAPKASGDHWLVLVRDRSVPAVPPT